MRPPRWFVALVAATLVVRGGITAVYLFAGVDTFRDLNRGRGEVVFQTDGGTLVADEDTLAALHERTLAYVLGNAPEPATLPDGRPLFDAGERSHLADVRAVFAAVRVAWIAAGIAFLAALVVAVRQRWTLRAARSGALVGGAFVLVIALVAATAFEPAFLLFHRVFFPQGNFLFDPATSNLLRLYPESYWYGVTMRIGALLLAAAALIALAATAALRRWREP